jgi:nucleotide-binding universal stress UspA family protein
MKTWKPFHFGTLVAATDFTDSGSCALRYATKLARVHKSKLIVVHAIDPAGYAFPSGLPGSAAADRGARAELLRIEEELRREHIPIHSVVETGVIYECILQAAADHHADLLVLGTRAAAQIGRAALGTVARRLLAAASCPVLTVPSTAASGLESAGHWHKVLVATDFSPASLSALEHAQSIVGSQLVVVHAAPEATSHERDRHLGYLRMLAPFNQSHTVPVEHIVSSGEAASAVAEEANRMQADLVVLGSPIDALRDEDFETSTVLQVISNVSCPVLCVPASRRSSVGDVVRELALSA